LQVEGVSHSHLYLFQADGKLIRQLTKSDAGQDADPVFSPDGKSVLYVRMTGAADAPVKEWRMVSVEGKNDRALPEAPDWREKQAAPAPFLKNGPANPGTGTVAPYDKAGDVRFELKNGGGVLTLKDDPAEQTPGDAGFFPKVNWFRSRTDEPEVNLATQPVMRPKRAPGEKEFWAGPLPGGVVPAEQMPEDQPDGPEVVPQSLLFSGDSPFLAIGPVSLAVFTQHLGSTDGQRLIAADLGAGKLFELAPNGGAVAVLEGIPAFACVCAQRYLPLGDGRTVNCSYLDLWEPVGKSGLRRIRFAEAKTGVFHGSSLRLPAKDGMVVFHIPGFQN
jgi:hypothetical protein